MLSNSTSSVNSVTPNTMNSIASLVLPPVIPPYIVMFPRSQIIHNFYSVVEQYFKRYQCQYLLQYLTKPLLESLEKEYDQQSTFIEFMIKHFSRSQCPHLLIEDMIFIGQFLYFLIDELDGGKRNDLNALIKKVDELTFKSPDLAHLPARVEHIKSKIKLFAWILVLTGLQICFIFNFFQHNDHESLADSSNSKSFKKSSSVANLFHYLGFIFSLSCLYVSTLPSEKMEAGVNYPKAYEAKFTDSDGKNNFRKFLKFMHRYIYRDGSDELFNIDANWLQYRNIENINYYIQLPFNLLASAVIFGPITNTFKTVPCYEYNRRIDNQAIDPKNKVLYIKRSDPSLILLTLINLSFYLIGSYFAYTSAQLKHFVDSHVDPNFSYLRISFASFAGLSLVIACNTIPTLGIKAVNLATQLPGATKAAAATLSSAAQQLCHTMTNAASSIVSYCWAGTARKITDERSHLVEDGQTFKL